MKFFKIFLAILFIVCNSELYSQDIDYINNRLSAVSTNDKVFYNIDGVNFTSQILYEHLYTEKGLQKAYRKFSIKDDDIKIKDDSLGVTNIYIHKREKIGYDLISYTSFYFVPNDNNQIMAIGFNSLNKYDKSFERDFAQMIIKNVIPRESFTPMTIDSINFAGRKIKLSNACKWTNINTVQCPYHGEMNWSVHKDFDDAKSTVLNQLLLTKNGKGVKVVSEEIKDIIFEEKPTKAQKIVYDITGINSLLAGMSGGKTLTAYYVAEKVRDNYVSCVLSFWNNDEIKESGLPLLLEQVMKLQK